jgi:3-oxoacyl-[acyl-carrier protein] reductase
MNGQLYGQTAIITGATAGIGREIAKRYAEEGAFVVVIGTSTERGEQVVSEIKKIPNTPGAIFLKVNVSNYLEVEQSVKQVIELRGTVDILVNNAGITRDQLLIKMNEDDWDSVMDVNVKSCYNTCKALYRTFIKAKKGRIINMSSVVGLTGNAGQVNYAASKAAIIGLTKSLAKELASRNILVNCIAPGFVKTSMTDEMTEAQHIATLERIPLGRMGLPVDIANTAVFLGGPWANYITGQVITVDGGMVM